MWGLAQHYSAQLGPPAGMGVAVMKWCRPFRDLRKGEESHITEADPVYQKASQGIEFEVSPEAEAGALFFTS